MCSAAANDVRPTLIFKFHLPSLLLRSVKPLLCGQRLHWKADGGCGSDPSLLPLYPPAKALLCKEGQYRLRLYVVSASHPVRSSTLIFKCRMLLSQMAKSRPCEVKALPCRRGAEHVCQIVTISRIREGTRSQTKRRRRRDQTTGHGEEEKEAQMQQRAAKDGSSGAQM